MSAKPREAWLIGLALAVLLYPHPTGAADDQVAEVTGKITLNGKPLPSGRLILFPVGADQFVGAKTKEGTYKN
jgi:hypothetical protein